MAFLIKKKVSTTLFFFFFPREKDKTIFHQEEKESKEMGLLGWLGETLIIDLSFFFFFFDLSSLCWSLSLGQKGERG